MFIGQVFDWLSSGVSSLASAGRSFRELGAAVASCSLPRAIYSLFKSSEDGEPSITKCDLRQLCDVNFAWPTDTSVEKILVLPKNIAKNFMQNFFKKFGFGLTVAKGQRVLRKVRVTIPCISPFAFRTIFFIMLMLFLFVSVWFSTHAFAYCCIFWWWMWSIFGCDVFSYAVYPGCFST
jgi:hypothetical protein